MLAKILSKLFTKKVCFRYCSTSPETPPSHLKPVVCRQEKSLPPAKYGGRYLVTMVPGDGVGKEIMQHVFDIFELIRAPIDFEIIHHAEEADLERIIDSARRNRATLKSHMETWSEAKEKDSPNATIRRRLNLYAYTNEFQSFKNIRCKFTDVDIILVRECTEGEYAMLEHETVKGMISSLKIITKPTVNKVANFAVDMAKERKRRLITVIHKAGDFKLTDGVFLHECLRVGRERGFPMNAMTAEAACMQMVMQPQQFDVLLTPNLYGNVLSSICCGILGGAGIYGAAVFGENCALFEPVFRSRARSLVNKDIANPMSFIAAGVGLLTHLDLHDRASMIALAVRELVQIDGVRTQDIGGTHKTSDFIGALKAKLQKMMKA